jgi:membrane-associated protease RseP (regulator of RpoE activity)
VTSLEQARSFIQRHPGERLKFVVLRGGRPLTLAVTPADGRHVYVEADGRKVPMTDSKVPVGFLGIEEQQYQVNVTSNPLVAIGRAGAALGRVTGQVALGFAQVFSLHGLSSFGHDVAAGISGSNTAGAGATGPSTAPTGPPTLPVKGQGSGNAGAGSSSDSSTGIISVVGAAELAVQALHQSISVALGILVAINISIGLINLFPMLPFDGGHVAIAVYERLRSRRGRRYYVDVRKLMPMTYLVIAFMLILGTGAVYLNIVHPVHLPGG